jgi:hypothetical protein
MANKGLQLTIADHGLSLLVISSIKNEGAPYRVQQKNLMVFKVKENENYTIFLREFITKIIFISNNFNYSIHFLNILSMRWCPLSTQSRKRFWKNCTTCCSIVGEIVTTSSRMFCFKSTVVLGFFSYTLLLSHPQSKKSQVLRSGDLAGHSIFPLREIMQAGNISDSQCEPLPRLAATRESGFQHQVSATPVPEMCEASQCSGLNLLLLPTSSSDK